MQQLVGVTPYFLFLCGIIPILRKMAEFEMIAKTFQGLEEVLAKELTELGANGIAIGNRMVSFTGDKELMYKANFHLRTAIRILKPFAHFKASSADEVYEKCSRIGWEEFLDVNSSFAVDSVVYSEEFKHSKFLAYRVKDAVADYFREKYGRRPNVSVSNPDILFHIHVSNGDCSLSIDSSGESLHCRGYRQDTMEAPLNEVLAAGMILMTGWHGQCDFIDPMCGSGTLPIEAALIARGMAPGLFRTRYAFEKWKDFDSEMFERIYNDDSAERPFSGHIYGYDKDAKAILASKRNAKAAGVIDMIHFETRDLKDFAPVTEKSLMVTNPPYGERLREGDIPMLYQTLGERLKHAFTGSEAWVISNHYEYFDKIGLKPSVKVPLYNGALACEFRKYEVFGGRYDSFRSDGNLLHKEDSSTKRGKTLRHKAAQAERTGSGTESVPVQSDGSGAPLRTFRISDNRGGKGRVAFSDRTFRRGRADSAVFRTSSERRGTVRRGFTDPSSEDGTGKARRSRPASGGFTGVKRSGGDVRKPVGPSNRGNKQNRRQNDNRQ